MATLILGVSFVGETAAPSFMCHVTLSEGGEGATVSHRSFEYRPRQYSRAAELSKDLVDEGCTSEDSLQSVKAVSL